MFNKLTHCIVLILYFSLQANVVAEDNHDHSYMSEMIEHEKHQEENHKHEEHSEDEKPELIFSKAALEEFSIKLAQAKSGTIDKTLDLTGEVIVAPERLYHVIPRVSGAVRKVLKHLGEKVEKGELLATLSSRDLADAKAQYLAADSLFRLANENLKREQKLYKSQVSSKRIYLAAKQTQAEMSINRKAAQQRLKAIGFTKALSHNGDQDLTLYELRAPSDGIIIEKHAALGEVLDTETRSFTIADLSKVWVNLTVYQKDLPFIQQGQPVTISTRFGLMDKATTSNSHIRWLSPVLDERTRSATARVVINNQHGQWRPGLFVSGKVSIEQTKAAIVIPLSALQMIEGQTTVFVQHAQNEFEPQVVQTGRRDHQQVEVLQGLKLGQMYVSENAFVLKAQSQKSSFGHGHSH